MPEEFRELFEFCDKATWNRWYVKLTISSLESSSFLKAKIN